ncbi:MAG: short chain dehydrogenase, partial [Actinomyces graevenitzii]|nr:short chain dehydrogenase [Actinomyces graevenitzii]
SVAKAIRLAVDMSLDATIEDLHIRPSDLPKN